jgi:hypothetical protein
MRKSLAMSKHFRALATASLLRSPETGLETLPSLPPQALLDVCTIGQNRGRTTPQAQDLESH